MRFSDALNYEERLKAAASRREVEAILEEVCRYRALHPGDPVAGFVYGMARMVAYLDYGVPLESWDGALG